MDLNRLKKEFYQQFGREDDYPSQLFFAPGRVCLIGDHIDYCGGLVMPAAISRGISAVYRKEDNDVIWMRSTLDKKDVIFPLNHDIVFDKARGWGNYPLGVIHLLRQQGIKIGGCELLFHSNLPVGAGLSSSAAVEVLTAYIFSHLYPDCRLDKVALALLAQKAENEFVGLECGIMDQFAVAMGKQNHAMVLNCGTLEHEYVPVPTDEYALLIMNTNKSRELAESKYNERTAECREALGILQKYSPIQYLVQADLAHINQYISDPVVRRRATHVVTENQRVLKSAEVLKRGNLATFGKLMIESHQSLKLDYEVSGLELDTLVDAALAHPQCLGARMTGAGFSGCAVALVKREAIGDFTDKVLMHYYQTTGLNGDIFVAELSDGVHSL